MTLSFEEAMQSNNPEEIMEVANEFHLGDRGEENKGKSLPLYERVVELDPSNAVAFNQIGVCHVDGMGVEANESNAKPYYLKAAELGNDIAQYNLATILLHENNPECVQWYEKACAQNNSDALYQLGCIYRDGELVETNVEKFLSLFERAVEQGNAAAKGDLAVQLLKGENTEQNVERGIALLEDAANSGEANACNNLSIIYHYGDYVPKDMPKAVYWAEKASELGKHDELVDLAVAYFLGKEELPIDKPYAFSLMLKSANDGAVVSMENVAICYNSGDGVEKDVTKAKEFFIKAANQGSRKAYNNLIDMCDDDEFIQLLKGLAEDPGYYSAMMMLFDCYTKGIHAEKDEAQAKYYLEEAIKGEFSEACFTYGCCLFFGNLGYEKNPTEALKYLEIASQKGVANASKNLGLAYEEGKIVEQDLAKAKEYYYKAAKQGDSFSYIYLGGLYEQDDSIPDHYQLAMNCYIEAYKQGEVRACYRIGNLYDGGLGVEKDFKKAAEYYQIGMEKGDLDCQTLLGLIYHDQLLTDKTVEYGVELIKDAASKGNKRSQRLLNDLSLKNDGSMAPEKVFAFNFEQAQNGNADAQFEVYKAYDEGRGVEQNKEEALKWLKESSNNGNIHAQAHLGLRAFYENDLPSAIKLFEPSALDGNYVAMHYLGLIFLYGGDGVQIDETKGIEWLEKSAEQEYDEAQTTLGLAYAAGRGVPVDKQKAFNLLNKAASQGNETAQYWVGVMYRDGDGVQVNKPLALNWLDKAARQGNHQAKYDLACMLIDGDGVPANQDYAINLLKEEMQDKESDCRYESMFKLAFLYNSLGRTTEAFPLWIQLAEHGDSASQYNLAIAYKNGYGTTVNYQLALQWLEKVAYGGDIQAKLVLADMYAEGQGTPKNVGRAIQLYQEVVASNNYEYRDTAKFKLAYYLDDMYRYAEAIPIWEELARQGNTTAMYNLGILHANGRGTPVDMNQARYWWKRAADLGDKDAHKQLVALHAQADKYAVSGNQNSNSTTSTKSGGCYVATAVYGSYDCPEVWVLRRYRDYSLASTVRGRAFIKLYYFISPFIVRRFGTTKWFNKFFRKRLNKFVLKLSDLGFSDTPYNDKNY